MNLAARIVRKIRWTINGFTGAVRVDGFSKTVKNKMIGVYINRVMTLLRIPKEGKTYLRYARDSKYPLRCRFNTSDAMVFHTVFDLYDCGANEYGSLNDTTDVRLVIDCGANVGYSAAYFLTRFPQAKVIAVEPDSENFALMERNLKPYGDRVKLYQTGVWSHTTGLTVCRGQYRDGEAWATQVRESLPEETPDVHAIDIGTILRESGFDKIDILKIDIERSETEVFARNYDEWLRKTRNMVIELHDEECEQIFYRAIADYSFSLSRFMEIVICKGDQQPNLAATTRDRTDATIQ